MRYRVKNNRVGWFTYDEDRALTPPSVTVFDTETPTGLLNVNGDPIVRVNEPIGFRFQDNEPQDG